MSVVVAVFAWDCEFARTNSAPITGRILIFMNFSDSSFAFLIGYLRGPAWMHF
jgi:hypothetical protein